MRTAISKYARTAGVAAISLAVLAACGDASGGTSETDNSTAAAASATSAPPAPQGEVPAECGDLPLSVTDIEQILGTTVTSARYSSGSAGGGDLKACYFTTTNIRVGRTAQDKRVVAVSVIAGASKSYWEDIVGDGANTAKVALGEGGIANTGVLKPDIAFRMGTWIVGVGFLDETGSPKSHEQAMQLAEKLVANVNNR